MRANYRLQRLFVDQPLSPGAAIAANDEQYNYLVNVLRMEADAPILLFNGRDGEWLAKLAFPTRKKLILIAATLERKQTPPTDLVYLFAPLKVGRMDYLVQKAVEMGAGILQPVMTQHVQGKPPTVEKLRANVIEAAEQCGIISVPDVRPAEKLEQILAAWPQDRRIIYCDESATSQNPLPALAHVTEGKIALLVGPEGGFSDSERTLLRSLPFVTAIPLGPRILRADTAAVAALAIIQASLGDWH